ncbi:M10 family metallopeptidase C-terminal domain-containing protein [Sinorhizobium numidicum]|uniref:M10 family metallopeptidase C-terminal domain-containing protein n=1 Tax=Sinorhizobium numidicum TaxID=680248 RepID=A0ABY8CUF3_9HYPH|nr:M10 family metallopeptidase [Sinorhizobium numidicum]WEX75098.1 M10 family metallopeptidase C-terminal domain-containing protein [Sinorhizobium numidicum]WEX81092.1 M10 family metallopeptidase C-terminal domain-containing protein [Sinorhizobium numidicum]
MSGTGKTLKTVNPTGNDLIDGVLSGLTWNSTVTYAFPTSGSSYSYGGEKDSGFAAISQAQTNAALFGVEQSYGSAANDGFSVEGFTNANFTSGSAATATIRFAQSTVPKTAYAYMPGAYDQAGDIWFGTAYAGTVADYRKPAAGNYAWHALLHELGHALGLKHGHEVEGAFNALPAQYDSIEYSIMTYRGYVGANGYYYEQYGAPQSFMMADIAALQEMYGADFTTNSGNSVYKWTPSSGATLVNGAAAISPGGNRIFATIWDGGGNDTFDLTAYTTGLKIDLRPGMASTLSVDQLAWLGGGANNGFAAGNIFNALLYHGDTRSLIENVNGGSAADTITGNQAANTLWGNDGSDVLNGDSGNDALYGGLGRDKVRGGDGNDRILGGGGADHLSGGTGADTFVFKRLSESTVASTGRDTIYDFLPSQSDKISLSAIDAQLGRSNQAFLFVETAAFSGSKGELRYDQDTSGTYIYGDVNGDKNADFAIYLDDAITLEKDHFVL